MQEARSSHAVPRAAAPAARASILGGLLRAARVAADLTLEALAERSGVSARTISDIERGVSTRPRRATTYALADALGLADASQFYIDLSDAFFGANREGSHVSEGAKRDFWRQGMLVNLIAAYDCVAAFSETDFSEDLKALDVPILLAHGDDDQIVPIANAALKSAELVKHGTVKVYAGAPHGIAGEYQAQLDRDILAFIAD
jgi:pimeloyl-ACP methyl ester carboxylesterase